MNKAQERLKEIEKSILPITERLKDKKLSKQSLNYLEDELLFFEKEKQGILLGIEETKKEMIDKNIHKLLQDENFERWKEMIKLKSALAIGKQWNKNFKSKLLEKLKAKRVCYHEVANHEKCSHKAEDGCYVNLIDFGDIEQELK